MTTKFTLCILTDLSLKFSPVFKEFMLSLSIQTENMKTSNRNNYLLAISIFGPLTIFILIFGINFFVRSLAPLAVFSLGVFLIRAALARLKINLNLLYTISVCVLFLYLYAITWSKDPSPLIAFLLFFPYLAALLLFLFSIPYNHFKNRNSSSSNN